VDILFSFILILFPLNFNYSDLVGRVESSSMTVDLHLQLGNCMPIAAAYNMGVCCKEAALQVAI
jgi:hypothetical protein